jgi:molybdopterin/thiamine biosynthesis adenylyltransferase
LKESLPIDFFLYLFCFFLKMQRYSRQVALPEVGEEGQRKLARATVAIVGVGGTGCAAASSLAAMGIGRLILIDPDVVEECNLHRQLLYRAADIGNRKAEVAAARLKEMNPGLKLEAVSKLLTEENARSLLKIADVVVDGSDNNSARLAINKACLKLGKPWVYGAAEEFEGRLAAFLPPNCSRSGARYDSGACYSCAIGKGRDTGCRAVLGVIPQIIGCAQALEAAKLLLGIGELLAVRLAVFDGKSRTWKELLLKKNADCKICSASPR